MSYGGSINIYNNSSYTLGYNIIAINSVSNPYPVVQTSGTSTYTILGSGSTYTYSTSTGISF